MADQSERITEALAPYGIVTTDAFWKQYHTDVMVYSLVNIVLGQEHAMKEVVEEAFNKGLEEGAKRAVAQIKKLTEAES